MSNESQARADFAKAIKLAGLLLEGDPIMDGAFHRLPVADGKARAKDGTYVGFLDGLNFSRLVLANAFSLRNVPYSWKKGRTELWRP